MVRTLAGASSPDAHDLANAKHQTPVVTPGYGVRLLEPGSASAIPKGVIEEWAQRRLAAPLVSASTETGRASRVLSVSAMTAGAGSCGYGPAANRPTDVGVGPRYATARASLAHSVSRARYAKSATALSTSAASQALGAVDGPHPTS
jgi:hypothetical protein